LAGVPLSRDYRAGQGRTQDKLWNYVISHFEKFLTELELSQDERRDAETKAQRVAKSLFADYYPGQTFSTACYGIVGSYGKGTAAQPRTDVDMIFGLPATEFSRIDALSGNKQSQLLQEVKESLLITFPNTDIRGDGPVVKVPFSTYYFEVVPVFRWDENLFLTAHTKNGGYWGYTNPAAEMQWLRNVDVESHGKATHLVKMLKAWKRECNVEIRSICLETLAILFVSQWINKDKSIFYYDWMIRDFFAYLRAYVNGWVKPAGIDEQIQLGNLWESKSQSAYNRALKACEYEYDDKECLAATEWQKIFGPQFRANLDLSKLLAGLGALKT
jgi:hypothetical protein